MTVNRIDIVLPEQLHETTNACGVEWTANSEKLRRYASSAEKIAQPPDAVDRPDWHDHMASSTQLLGEAKDHHFRASGTVGLEHHRDAQLLSRHERAPIQRTVSFQNGSGSFQRRISS
jgi:hypothetical protein